MAKERKVTDIRTQDFHPSDLDNLIIAKPLQDEIDKKESKYLKIMIDLHLNYPGGRDDAKEKVLSMIDALQLKYAAFDKDKFKVYKTKTDLSSQYVFAIVPVEVILMLIEMDSKKPGDRSIYKIWLDFELSAQTIKSTSTIKADAARLSFSALGENIVWAVADSGIDITHKHFQANKHDTYHLDLVDDFDPFDDEFGHGTHVAGIIAGEMILPAIAKGKKKLTYALISSRNEQNNLTYQKEPLERISGIAPKCKLVSIKILDGEGKGQASSLIAAIGHIQKINNYGRDIKIHGLNLSVGYSFDPEWFACGQSPVCVEVDRLVKSGVVVVAAAGNTGYGFVSTAFNARMAMGFDLSINDPGNAELAITVGSTHKDMPHTFGVSYFSSKGPTGDGRLKPDLVAPGEKIISCVSNAKRARLEATSDQKDFDYVQDSGTSMAAPHVSGAIAAFLSIRREYIGQPEKVKEIFNSTATDLKRDKYFQGHGLIDLMRAIQSI